MADRCPDCGADFRHAYESCPARTPGPTPTGDRTFVASPHTGLIYGSASLWRDASFAFRSWLDELQSGKPVDSGYYDFHLITDYSLLPDWARDLTPGENVDLARR